MTPQETEQVAALRMHVAHLVNALKGALQVIDDKCASGVDSDDAAALARAALAESEPSVRDLLAEADRDAKLQACREQLAETTARLAKVEAAARNVAGIDTAELHGYDAPGADAAIHALKARIDALTEALA